MAQRPGGRGHKTAPGGGGGSCRAVIPVGMEAPRGRGSPRRGAAPRHCDESSACWEACPSGSRRSRPRSVVAPAPARGSLLCLHSSRLPSPVRLRIPHWMRTGGGSCVHPAPGRSGEHRGAPALGRVPPQERTRRRTSGSLLLRAPGPNAGSRGARFCLLWELKVQEVFRHQVTGGTCRIFFFFFSVSVETYSEQGSNAWRDV